MELKSCYLRKRVRPLRAMDSSRNSNALHAPKLKTAFLETLIFSPVAHRTPQRNRKTHVCCLGCGCLLVVVLVVPFLFVCCCFPPKHNHYESPVRPATPSLPLFLLNTTQLSFSSFSEQIKRAYSLKINFRGIGSLN